MNASRKASPCACVGRPNRNSAPDRSAAMRIERSTGVPPAMPRILYHIRREPVTISHPDGRESGEVDRQPGLLEYGPVKTTEASAMLSTVVPEPAAWHGPTLAAERYLVPIPAAVLGELLDALAELRRAPVPTLLLLPE